MKQYVDLYVHNSDIARLESGEEVHGYINVNDKHNYTLVPSYALIVPYTKVDINTFSICAIMK